MKTFYAFIKNGIVENVIVAEEYSQDLENSFINMFGLDSIVPCGPEVSTGFTYQDNDFMPPKPFNSWIWDKAMRRWNPPVEKPSSMVALYWNEDSLSWDQSAL